MCKAFCGHTHSSCLHIPKMGLKGRHMSGLLDTASLWSGYTILHSPHQFTRPLVAFHLCQHLVLLVFLILAPLIYSSMCLWLSFEFSWWEVMLRALAYAYWPFVYFLLQSGSQGKWGSGGGSIHQRREIKLWFGKAELSVIIFPSPEYLCILLL